jgi:hypothetical protein
LEIAQLADAEIAVAPGDVEEQVPDGADAGFGCGLGGLGAYAVQRAQALR